MFFKGMGVGGGGVEGKSILCGLYNIQYKDVGGGEY